MVVLKFTPVISTFGMGDMLTPVPRRRLTTDARTSIGSTSSSARPSLNYGIRNLQTAPASTIQTAGPGAYNPTIASSTRSGKIFPPHKECHTIIQHGQAVYLVPDKVSQVSEKYERSATIDSHRTSTSVRSPSVSSTAQILTGRLSHASTGRISQLPRDLPTLVSPDGRVCHYGGRSLSPPVGWYRPEKAESLIRPKTTACTFPRSRNSVCESIISPSRQSTMEGRESNKSVRSQSTPKYISAPDGHILYGKIEDTPAVGQYNVNQSTLRIAPRSSSQHSTRDRKIHYGEKTAAQHLDIYQEKPFSCFNKKSFNVKLGNPNNTNRKSKNKKTHI